jgi:hypothetical protein
VPIAAGDGRTEASQARASGWFEKAVEAANRIEPDHTAPWKLARTCALLSIAETLLLRRTQQPARSATAIGVFNAIEAVPDLPGNAFELHKPWSG